MKHAKVMAFILACSLIGSAYGASGSVKRSDTPAGGEVKGASAGAKKASGEKGKAPHEKINRQVESGKQRRDKQQPAIDLGCITTD